MPKAILKLLCRIWIFAFGLNIARTEGILPQHIETLTVFIGQTAELNCTFSAVPAPNITWAKNDPITETNTTKINTTKTNNTTLSILMLANTTKENAGNYTCTGTNMSEDVSHQIVLKVYDHLETLTLTSSNITSSSVVLRWCRKSKLEDKDFRHIIVISWGENNSFQNFINISAEIGTFQATKEITHLKPYTWYSFAVRQVVGLVQGNLSNVLNLTTNEDAPCPPQNLTTVVQKDSIQIKWKEPACPNGLIVEYDIFYQYNANGTVRRMNKTSTNTNITLTDLYPYVKYRIQVAAKTQSSYGELASIDAETEADKPRGAPTNFKLMLLNSTTVCASWNPVLNYLQGGQINQYVIKYNKTGDLNNTTKEIYVNAWHMNSIISDLEFFTTYEFAVAASTNDGLGPANKSFITTGEGIPSKPLNVTGRPVQTNGKQQSITLAWIKPEHTNGNINMIQIVYMKVKICTDNRYKRSLVLNQHYYENVTFIGSRERMIDRNFDPFSKYTIKIREGTSVGWGEYSDSINVTTLEGLPSAPVNLTLVKITDRSILLQWSKPLNENGIISKYYLTIKNGDRFVNRVQYDVMENHPLQFEINERIEPETSYSIEITAETNCNCGFGETSEKLHVMTQTTPAKFPWMFVLVGCLLVILFIALAILIILFITRRRQNYKEVKQNEDMVMSSLCGSKPIPVGELKLYCTQQHANSDHGFQQEFESVRIPAGTFTWEHSQIPANQIKNRYSNIVAYDHSRVVLSLVGNDIHSDYINANYIDGFNKPKKYIATQGPLPETVLDFWRMVWEQECNIIVMLTKLVEDSRVKCEQYWPDGKGLQYGSIVVTVNSVNEMTDYTVRVFTLHKFHEPEVRREVHQYHYTAWPDHGVPSHPTSLLSFIRHVMSVMDNMFVLGPVIVHCSAGVGRTGTFICIESCLNQAESENIVDVFGHVYKMRKDRNWMVQVEAQYTLIYDALLDHVLCGNTEIQPAHLVSKINALNKDDPQTGGTLFAVEFKSLETGLDYKLNKNQFTDANHVENKHKNRLLNILPYDSNRVRLMHIAGARNNDYINASFIDGFQQKNAFIATQAPLENTVKDFWRMVFEQNIHIIVMLTKLEERGQEKCYLYWPQAGTVSYGTIHVELLNVHEEADRHLIISDLRVTNRETGRSWTVTHYMYLGWPEYGSPESGVELICLIGMVQQSHKQDSNGSPILVHCSGGVGRTGVFMGVFNSIERLKAKNVVDIFHTVRSLRLQRTAMVQTIDQYMFCYQCVVDYLNSFHLYTNSVSI